MKRCLSVAACGCALDNLRPDTKTYTYDALGRLLAVNASVSPDKAYDYSADGNLELKDNNTQFYGENFDGDHAVTSINDGSTFAYDDNGNMTSMVKSGVTTGYVYDPENRLTKVTQNSVTLADYTYDDFGERVSKKVNGQRTDYFYPFYEKSAQKEDQYVIFDGVRVARGERRGSGHVLSHRPFRQPPCDHELFWHTNAGDQLPAVRGV